mgnify:FL=1|tara:strand:+ start:100 stop:672 length:573 start_codon:yes stop_codon:yes gene_type:complete
MERKDLQFGVDKIQHQWYFHFDVDTGMVNSMSVNKQDSSIAIPDSLAQDINSGNDNMTFYKVIFEDGKYNYINTVKITPTVQTKNERHTINKSFYKIKINNSDAKILFEHRGTELSISATAPMQKIIKDTFKKDSIHRFFVCKKNDHSILYKTINLNLYDLCEKSITVALGIGKDSYTIYCRKLLEYSHV